MFTLTLDLAGPVKPGLDVSSKGTMGRGLRYLLVAKYVFPKEFAKAYSGREPPRDDGLEMPVEVGHEEGDQGSADGKELVRPSLLPPHGEGDPVEGGIGEVVFSADGEELARPSLLPPHGELDSCVEGGIGEVVFSADGEELARP